MPIDITFVYVIIILMINQFLAKVVDYEKIKEQIDELDYAFDTHDCRAGDDGACRICIDYAKKRANLMYKLKE